MGARRGDPRALSSAVPSGVSPEDGAW
jgi:hypothetical protein